MTGTSKTVVFRAHLLLGDALYATCTIGRYVQDHPDESVIIECLDEYPQEVYQWIPGNPQLTYATDTPCDVRYEFDPNAAMIHAVDHKQPIWKSMGEILGLPSNDKPILNIPELEIPEEWKGAFIISPFSRSCTSHSGLPANKTFPVATWLPLLRYLRRRGKLLIVSGRQERMDGFAIDESERLAGFSLTIVASVMRQAKCVICLDNGLARLSTLTGAETLTLMPEFLPLEVFAPAPWARETSFIAQIDVRMDSSAYTAAMKQLLRVHLKVT